MVTNFEGMAGNLAPTHVAINGCCSDANLIERIAAGNKLAIRALYGRHNTRVFRFALQMLRNEFAAEDIVSEVFLEVWRKADSFESRSQVSTWLLAIAHHKAVELIRRRSTEQLDEKVAAKIEDPSDNPETATPKKEIGSIIGKCLTQLSPEHREIIDLVYYHGKSVDEVVAIIGITRNTVKTRMFYARKRLAGLLRLQGITTAVA